MAVRFMVIANGGNNKHQTTYNSPPQWNNEIEITHYTDNDDFVEDARFWLLNNIGEEKRTWAFAPSSEDLNQQYNPILIRIIIFKEYEDAWKFLEWLEDNGKN